MFHCWFSKETADHFLKSERNWFVIFTRVVFTDSKPYIRNGSIYWWDWGFHGLKKIWSWRFYCYYAVLLVLVLLYRNPPKIIHHHHPIEVYWSSWAASIHQLHASFLMYLVHRDGPSGCSVCGCPSRNFIYDIFPTIYLFFKKKTIFFFLRILFLLDISGMWPMPITTSVKTILWFSKFNLR